MTWSFVTVLAVTEYSPTKTLRPATLLRPCPFITNCCPPERGHSMKPSENKTMIRNAVSSCMTI